MAFVVMLRRNILTSRPMTKAAGAPTPREVASRRTDSADSVSAAGAEESRAVVCMLCPGGLEHAGGIGRWAGYLVSAWEQSSLSPPLRIVDTRGFGGALVAGLAFARALGQLAWLRCTGRLGVVHANLSVRGSTLRKCIFSELAWLAGVPVIVHLHSGRFLEFYRGLPPWAQAAVRRMFTRAARVIVLGKVWEDALAAELNVPRAKIVVLFNAVAAADLSRRSGAAEDGTCHIVMLGRLGPAKGLPELMEALGSETLRGLRWRATLAGDGDAQRYRREAEAAGIADRIAFPGWLDADAVSHLLLSADILVLPSRSENLPVAVIEAMAHAVAIVTTPVGATPEIVTDGESALLVPIKDPAALADAMRRLIEQPELRERIGSAGRQAFEERLDIVRAARALAALYLSVIRERHA